MQSSKREKCTIKWIMLLGGFLALGFVGFWLANWYWTPPVCFVGCAAQSDKQSASSSIHLLLPPDANGEGERLWQDVLQDVRQLQQNYLAEVTAYGIDSVLDPQHLQRPGGFTRSYTILRQSHDAADRARRSHLALLANLPARIDHTNAPAGMKQLWLSFVQQQTALKRTQIDKVWQLEMQSIDATGKMLSVLEKGRWQYRNRQFEFSQAADLAEFDKYSVLVQNILQEQAQLRNTANIATGL